MEQLPVTAKEQLTRIESIATLIRQLDLLRNQTSGDVRSAYTVVIKTELYRMLRNIDRFKMLVCETMSDNDASELINRTMLPNLDGLPDINFC